MDPYRTTDTWTGQWGVAAQGSWGFDHMATPTDPASPTNPVLDVTYGNRSSARSCTDCPTTGGGEFYTLFRQLGRTDLADAPSLTLKYRLKFPTGFDWGRGGKLLQRRFRACGDMRERCSATMARLTI